MVRQRNIPLYVIDIAYCAVFVPLVIYLMPVERWWGAHPVFLGLFIAWLYCNYFAFKYFIVPSVFGKGSGRVMALLAVAVSIAGTVGFASYRIESPYSSEIRAIREAHSDRTPKLGMYHYKQAVWLHYLVVVSFSAALGLLTEAYKLRRYREELELERKKAELALYKARINPHFLFNTLNSLYGLLLMQSDKTVETMERFINLVKYMYAASDKEYITVSEESEYIEEYIGLQRLRLNEMAELSFTTNLESPEMLVPPMLLITFVENAFKYGVSPDEPYTICAYIESTSESIHFCIENTIASVSPRSSHKSGIDNCRRRLELHYPERHKLSVGETAQGTFRVDLTLNPETA